MAISVYCTFSSIFKLKIKSLYFEDNHFLISCLKKYGD
jgi:hypothetical protein